ncbi:MAG: hypothetical protein ACO3XO_08990 [Bdellovibrionota bacterium]
MSITDEILNDFEELEQLLGEVQEEQDRMEKMFAVAKLDEVKAIFFSEIEECIEDGSLDSIQRAKKGLNVLLDSLMLSKLEV